MRIDSERNEHNFLNKRLNSEQTRLPHVIFDEAEEEEMGRTDVMGRTDTVVAMTTHHVWELWQRSFGSAQERMMGLLETSGGGGLVSGRQGLERHPRTSDPISGLS
jgi:hypothetical protein